ncbi:MAG: ABC transporter ATP-binding protein, partial [Bifidobacteriaceae bacterium]|nr:ABC transporter ATP-binding protein [Bifidobacteriaceae bacterium]
PTSGLDVTIQKLLLDQLSELAAKGLSILLITHDLGVARDRADRVLVMSRGRIVESGPVEQIFSEPADPYTRQLLAAAPSLNRRRLTGRGPVTRPLAAANESPLLEARGLTKLFNVGRGAASEPLRALEDVDLSIKRGSSLGVVGESGSGKTTLARIVADLTPPTSGDVVFDGARLSDLGRSERRGRRRRVQYVYQNPFVSLDPRFKVAEIIDEPLRSFRVGTRRSRQGRVRELLDLVALPADFAARRPGELSGGQRQRVAIARALALSPELLVLDEPVSALDVSVQAQVLQLLADLQHQLGLTYLFISHDLAVIRLVADEVAVLSGGRVVESGPTAQVLSAPSDDYTRRLLDAIPGRARATNPTPAKR